MLSLDELLNGVFNRDPRALGLLCRIIDDNSGDMDEALLRIYRMGGQGRIVGITGPPGAGKSTIIDHLIREGRSRNLEVGVLAVDPSSPLSGGAVLGDRVRMQEHAADPGVFIHSLAARGHLGGVSRSAQNLVTLLDAAGFDLIFLETVGIGQEEVQVRDLVQTVIYVTVPGLGDDVQAMKAGVLEIADIYLVNKADNPSADKTVSDLKGTLVPEERKPDWIPRVLSSIATEGLGMPELMEAIDRHFSHLEASGGLDLWRKSLARSSVLNSVEMILEQAVASLLNINNPHFERDIEKVSRKEKDPQTVALEWLRKLDLNPGR